MIDHSTVVSGYPVPIRQMFNILPEHIQRVDAVYERPIDGSILIFVGEYRINLQQ
jgi:hypothetical protein